MPRQGSIAAGPCAACRAPTAALVTTVAASFAEYARSLVHPRMNPYMATKKTGPTLAALNAQIAKLQAQAEALAPRKLPESSRASARRSCTTA